MQLKSVTISNFRRYASAVTTDFGNFTAFIGKNDAGKSTILEALDIFFNDGKLIDLIRIYFQDTAAKGITARNQLIEMATASLSDLMKEHPEHRAEAKQDLQLLNAQKMGEHEAEIEKIKNVFLAILRDIKKDIDNGEQPGEAVTAAMFQAMRDALAEQKQNPLSIDDVAAMVAGQIGQLTPMDEETADLFKQLAKKMMKGIE